MRLRNQSPWLKIQMNGNEYLTLSLFYKHPCAKWKEEDFTMRGGVIMDPWTVQTLACAENVCFNFNEDRIESVSILTKAETHDQTIEKVVNMMLHLRTDDSARDSDLRLETDDPTG